MSESLRKSFNLQEAKQGNQVITKDGRSVRIICFDAKMGEVNHNENKYPLIALVLERNNTKEREILMPYTIEGKAPSDKDNIDLFMA